MITSGKTQTAKAVRFAENGIPIKSMTMRIKQTDRTAKNAIKKKKPLILKGELRPHVSIVKKRDRCGRQRNELF